MRAQWPEPRPGASTELVETALVTGFAADRVGNRGAGPLRALLHIDGPSVQRHGEAVSWIDRGVSLTGRWLAKSRCLSFAVASGRDVSPCSSNGFGEWTTRGGCPSVWSSRSRSPQARCNVRSLRIAGFDQSSVRKDCWAADLVRSGLGVCSGGGGGGISLTEIRVRLCPISRIDTSIFVGLTSAPRTLARL